jgi:hypothetical protein
MRVLDITVDLGRSTTPSQVEAMVRAVRVACGVGWDAELRRVRRAAMEQMKYPTDAELAAATQRLPHGDEGSPFYRAGELRRLRRRLAEMPSELWWEYWTQAQRRSSKDKQSFLLNLFGDSGFERTLVGSLVPSPGGLAMGLEALDPELYSALVADQVSTLAPTQILVREVRYRNPFGETLTALGTGAEALNKTAGVVDTVATLGSRRKIKRAEAEVAEATVNDRIEASRLDVEFKREQLRQAQLANAMAEEELLAKQIANAQALGNSGVQQALIQLLSRSGQLDEADAVAAISLSDAAALTEFAVRPPKIVQTEEPDPDGD